MTTLMRSCMQLLLKLLNSFIGMCGTAMILYAMWMIRVWRRQIDSDHPPPWFMYTILGIGAVLCMITCSGHIAAATANGCCLYCYLVSVFLLLMLEGAVTIDVFLNPNWEEDFPQDPSGNLHDLRDFIKENLEMCKWVGLTILSVQGLSVFLAVILKALGPHQKDYVSDDEYTPEGVPLLRNYPKRSTYVVGDPIYGYKSNSWNS